ncbi:hypothetical protein NBH00_14085 [Paraconexibacter antarcticus]|uniref:LPXTG-motif cell wall-anchored protein n=1 Tax=Paraconexibacter antarcticus TaxID=2949664 RepID=A0ABY5DNX3_9ACTN|nr:hypothetical protein [Paraconexibacter antarcticus]UTI62492.1 hypothetical protein NBH00_14085 [Paraconexibacter antarcticus]
MRLPSRLPALLAAAAVGAAGLGLPAGAVAQSAGDQQYQDPLGGSATTSTRTGASSVPNPSTVPQLSSTTPAASAPAQPSLPRSTSTGSSTGSPPTTTSPTAATATTLPNTGLDGRILAGIGLGMLLCGLGLRLRTARERF